MKSSTMITAQSNITVRCYGNDSPESAHVREQIPGHSCCRTIGDSISDPTDLLIGGDQTESGYTEH